ncbi:hypothetical protein ACH5RR_018254 [Cinchona calisaya]|uniref:Uncharacterized protein n=1 Tax=Cinchona calisaya TaxID=153742 RepID=A0ABD2ZP33_9GENT
MLEMSNLIPTIEESSIDKATQSKQEDMDRKHLQNLEGKSSIVQTIQTVCHEPLTSENSRKKIDPTTHKNPYNYSSNPRNDMRELAQRDIMTIGDFNEVLSLKETVGTFERTNWKIRVFRQTLEYCNLTVLDFIGYPFTWLRYRRGHGASRTKLDRVLANNELMNIFPSAKAINLCLTNDEMEMAVAILWKIWSSRNLKLHEGRNTEHLDITNLAEKFLQDFKQANIKDTHQT